MADTIAFRGTTFFSSNSGGEGWSFTRGTVAEEANEVRAPLGTGFWIKSAGRGTATHSLELAWVTSTPTTTISAVQALATVALGDLVLPIHGTISNCRLSEVGEWRTTALDGGKYALETTLTFTEYP